MVFPTGSRLELLSCRDRRKEKGKRVCLSWLIKTRRLTIETSHGGGGDSNNQMKRVIAISIQMCTRAYLCLMDNRASRTTVLADRHFCVNAWYVQDKSSVIAERRKEMPNCERVRQRQIASGCKTDPLSLYQYLQLSCKSNQKWPMVLKDCISPLDQNDKWTHLNLQLAAYDSANFSHFWLGIRDSQLGRKSIGEIRRIFL